MSINSTPESESCGKNFEYDYDSIGDVPDYGIFSNLFVYGAVFEYGNICECASAWNILQRIDILWNENIEGSFTELS